MKRLAPLLLIPILVLASGHTARADAIVRSQAMFASTIAEFMVEEEGIELELEIGLTDLEAFRNLLPDEIYQELGHPPSPFEDRLRAFFSEDLALIPDGGEPLPGRVLEMGPRQRVRRDEITAEPLPPMEGEEELVIAVRIAYPLPGRPRTLAIASSLATRAASVGFVLYDRGIAVNDFRYLVPAQTLTFDWEDPWYSRFDARALRRAYFAPMSGFLYVEPFEVRKEIILRPVDLQDWIDLGLEGRETIPVEVQAELERQVAEFLRARQRVVIDGREIEPDLARINFLERTLKTSRVVEPREELDIYSATLGAIFVYPTEGLPQRVTMEWDLFNEKITRVPGAAVDQAGPLPTILEPNFPVLEWQNFLKNPELPTLTALAPPPSALERALGWPRWVLLTVCALLVFWRGRLVLRRQPAPVLGLVTALALLAAGASLWLGRDAGLSDDRAGEVVSGLLHNIYRAFDFREEEQIYDVLERSVEGDLLTRIYLETRRGLELANQGGARAKVKAIELVELEAESSGGGAFVARATWNVAGSVGHWGHVHERANQYQAEMSIAPVGGSWKLTGLEILLEERI
jgi:hypothetical protein